jgi:hypothetical protein
LPKDLAHTPGEADTFACRHKELGVVQDINPAVAAYDCEPDRVRQHLERRSLRQELQRSGIRRIPDERVRERQGNAV